MPFILLSLFLSSPAPLEMPRAEAFFVREGGRCRLEDRYEPFDLWTSQSVVGRWADEDGRVFLLADLDFEPPSGGEVLTRKAFAEQRTPMPRLRANREIPRSFRRAIGLLSNCPLTDEKPRRSRQIPHGYADVTYWQHPTNVTSVVCAFRQEKSEKWHLAVWTLADGDDPAEREELLEDDFLRKEFKDFTTKTFNLQPSTFNLSERNLLRSDARHSVAAYPNWHVADSEEFTVLDDALSRDLVATVTNELALVRSRAATVLPTSIDGSNVLCVARIFASRAEYLDALETDGNTNMTWSAAYWSPARRELVAYLPESGEKEFLKTLRHETFHQYLSYAASMLSVSPWLNEGYAQYFEDPESKVWGEAFDLSDEGFKRMARFLPVLLDMDYETFYAGTDAERRFKYRLAWSLAVFLEKGASKVRFDPFKDLKNDYFEALFRTKDMRAATTAAFKDKDTLGLFADEWLKFWRER